MTDEADGSYHTPLPFRRNNSTGSELLTFGEEHEREVRKAYRH